MARHAVRDPDFVRFIREDFGRQGFLATLDASLEDIEPGRVTVSAPFSDTLTQQDGFLHAGASTTLLDVACGYAARTLMASGQRVLGVELKVNFLAPAVGERFLAEGRVLRAGRTLSVCQGTLHADDRPDRPLVVMQTTMIAVGP